MTYLRGDIIIGQGDRGDSLYIILQGNALVKSHNSESEQLLSELKTNDFFGELALLGKNIRSATVEATSSCDLLRIRRNSVMLVAEEFPIIYKKLKEVESERIESD